MRVRRFSALRRSALTLSIIALSAVAITCGKDTSSPPPGASQLAFKVDPVNAMAGSAVAPAVVVEARDGNGALVSDFTGDVTLSLGANPGGGTLGGTTTVKAAGGVATFASLSIDKKGAGYRLKATSGSLTAAMSATFDISAGPATQLVFTTQPPTSVAGAGLAPAVTVSARDALGNVADGYTGSVTVAITNGTGAAGATLSGTQTMAAVAGIATFTTLSIDKVGTGYTLSASGTGLTGVTSAAFNITAGPASVLVISVQPTSAVAGQPIAPAIVVTARDNMGNTATGFAGMVTLGITPGSGTPGATLAGTSSTAASAGVATFSSLSIAKAGTAYTLTAAATGVPGVTTDAFDIAVGPTTTLSYVVGPSSTFAGAPIAPAVQVAAQDAAGNTDPTYTGNVTVTLAANPGAATLTGTTTMAAVAGIATFADLSLDKSGTGYTLQAAAAGLTSVTSAAFNNLAANGAQLVFVVEPPATATAGTGITPCVQVAVRDGLGNTATGFNGGVSLAIGANPAGGTLSGTTTVTAVAGVATFCGVSIDRAASGYTLIASASVLPTATSATFAVEPGAPDHLVFGQQPSAATAGAAIAPSVTVRVMDAVGNLVTGFSGNVAVAIAAGSGTSGASLSGSTTASAAGGVASFATLSIDKSGTGYMLSSTSSGLTGATSAPFDVVAGTASQLAIAVQPGNSSAGSAITPAIQVAALDALGNLATAFTGNVTVAITAATGTVGATLSGTITVPAAGGIATFSTLSIDKTGTAYTLTATANGLTETTTTSFDVSAGAAAKLVFTTQPTTTAAGASIATVGITAQDAVGNPVPTFTGDVTVSIAANPSAGTLSGTATVAAVAGVASFNTLSIDKSGAGYTLSAAATGLTPATSSPFAITAGPVAQLVFTVQPSAASAGVNIAPPVVVTGLDQLGNVATGFTGSVTMAIGTNPAAGTLSGTTSVAAAAGVATFSALQIDKAGTGYTLTASATGVPTATSLPFDISAGVATKLVFTVPPVNTVAGTAITPAVQVAALDAANNPVSGFAGDVTVAITSGTGTAGATLSGTTTVPAAGGIATLSTLSVDKAGTGYTLTATATGLTSATSTPFDVAAGAAAKLAFTTQPTTTTAGTPIASVGVSAQDAFGNPVSSFTGDVTVSIAANPSAGTLSGTATVAAVAGVASFSTLSIDKSGAGYALSAAATGLTPDTSSAFIITAGPVAQLVFTVQPSSASAGVNIAPPVVVTGLDQLGNVATGFTGSITMAIGTNPAAGTLSGTTSVAAAAGVATFSALKIDKAGTGYTLTASATGVPTATSLPFDIAVGVPTKLVFTVPPVNTVAGAAITPAVQVTALDASNNPVPTFAGSVTVAITSGSGTSGATLRGTTTVGAVAGIATFSTLSIDKTGTGYKLTTTSTGLTSATSGNFNITVAPAVKLGFTVQPPATATSGVNMSPTIRVAVQDSLGNTVTNFANTNVTMTIGTNPSAGTLSGTTVVRTSSGVASFSALKIDKAGVGYTLVATMVNMLSATSNPFTVNPGPATHLGFTVQPLSTRKATVMPPIGVSAFDAANNLATAFTGNITVGIGTNPNFGTLTGTTVVKAVAGVSTFSTLKIDSAGLGYTLTAAATGLTGATSASFDITAGDRLQFTVQPPSTAAAGAVLTPAIQVSAVDSLGAVRTAFTGNVTVALTGGPAGAGLTGTKTVAAVAGVATFSNLVVDSVGTGYKLTATASGLAAATSNAFNTVGGAAVKLGFIVQPSTTPAGALIQPGVQVAVQDAGGATVKGVSGSITIAIGANPSSGVLSGTLTVPINAGVGSFPNLSIDKAGNNYTLTASSTGLTGATSTPFNITAAATIHLVFSGQPVTTTAGQVIPGVQVTALNASNAVVTSFTGPITMAIAAGTGANGATLLGTTVVNAVNGVANFTTLSIQKAGTGFKLAASSPGVAGVNSASFTINADVPVTLHFAGQPTTTTVNTIITPAVTVDARDQFNNVVKAFVGPVTISIAQGTAGAVLAGTKTVNAVVGVATFSDLSINLPGTGNTAYRLSAAAAGLTSALSNAFSIN